MNRICYTLLSDGSSDEALISILTWLLQQYVGHDVAIQAARADLSRQRNPPKNLPDKIVNAIDLYPCDLLFLHRDAEGETVDKRLGEITQAIQKLRVSMPVIGVIPVHMTEAWLLFDETAIRRAAGNPNGKILLELPKMNRVEKLSDPKQTLKSLLSIASNLPKRRQENISIIRVAQLIRDFSPLRQLRAFQALEEEVKGVAQSTFIYK